MNFQFIVVHDGGKEFLKGDSFFWRGFSFKTKNGDEYYFWILNTF